MSSCGSTTDVWQREERANDNGRAEMFSLRATTRRNLRAVLLTIAVATALWAIWIALVGGFITTIGGLRIRSNNPQRVLVLTAIALGGYFLLGGVMPIRRLTLAVRRLASAIAGHPGAIAVLIAIATTVVAMSGSTRMAGGSDAYGYVSQADLWIHGSLEVRQPWVAEVPWPDAQWTFTPLGYRPVAREGEWAIVPTYSPGLPMLLAVAKRVGGQCVMYGVVPLLAGLAVLATYGIGRRLNSSVTGLIAAWLVATSPVTLSSSLEPLTDVPVMSTWALAFFFVLGQSTVSAAAAGLSAGLSILIRPNLVLLAVPLGLWVLCRRDVTGSFVHTRVVPAAVFAIGAGLGVGAVAAINQHLYGSPLTSGYGRLEDQVALARMLPNLRRYLSWFVETHSVVPLLGLMVLAAPLRRFWPRLADRTVVAAFGGVIILLWGFYAAYLEFDSWGYLRFLLPSWPLIMIGLGAIAEWVGTFGGVARWVAGITIVAVGVSNTVEASRRDVFEQRQAARHEAPIGRLVMTHTPPNSVLLTAERSGSMRYYGGRITLRYDLLHPDWLDRAVSWLGARGVRVYAVLDRRQADEVKARFSSQRTAAALDQPFLIYEPAGTALFDLSAPRDHAPPAAVITEPFPDAPHCDPPVPLLPLILK
jgi:4-amino-4-deoxy-L-arabinose transferase-like glycosyltransferase